MGHEGGTTDRTSAPPDASRAPAGADAALARTRHQLALVVGLAGVALYNWWVVVPFLHGWLSSLDGFFSDLSADGQAHALVLRRLDLVSATLILLALVVRGARGPEGPRAEWRWLVAFAAFGIVGARFPYACAEGLDRACRVAERHLQLAPHHYVHMVSGVAEFGCATAAIWLAHRRTRDAGGGIARVAHLLVVVLVVAYPLLGIAYLGDRLGSLIEPVFFVTFSAIVVLELVEPDGTGDPEVRSR